MRAIRISTMINRIGIMIFDARSMPFLTPPTMAT
ncbi:Uncharacterised protein [Vibrio cholerae]|nr:Uncharacterised protein [Vibrio cholerae]